MTSTNPRELRIGRHKQSRPFRAVPVGDTTAQGKWSKMNTYHGRMQGPADIEDDLAFYGHLDGGASVARGVKLQLHGIVTGDLTIEPDALVELRGRVHGAVTNRGRLIIYGQVGGVVTDEGGGQTTSMWPAAVMAGHHVSKGE